MSKPVVGQEAAIITSGGQVRFGYKVTKVTPSGQVVVEELRAGGEVHSRRFDSSGLEMNTVSSRYYKDRVAFNVAELRASEETKKRVDVAVTALQSVKVDVSHRYNYSKESLQQKVAALEALLDAARAAVEAV